MVLGIGVDILRIQRLEAAVRRSGRRFLEKVFSAAELECAGRREGYYIQYLAARFAGKEAVFKTFGIGWDSAIELKDIEIAEGEFGEPLVTLSGKAKEIAARRKAKGVLISLSYDTDYAVAFAILVGEQDFGGEMNVCRREGQAHRG